MDYWYYKISFKGCRMKEVTYKQGMTTVWSDGDKIKITSPIGKNHIEANVDQIFDPGIWKKIHDVHYNESLDATGRNYECISGYIPKRVLDDLIDDKELMKEYFSND